MKVVGLDLSLTSTGIAYVYPSGRGVTARVTSKGKAGATLDQRYARLQHIASSVTELIRGDLDLVVIEAPAMSRTTGHQHDRSGLWWLVVSWLRGHSIPVAEVAPTARAKYATGRGNAAKDDVLSAVIRRYPHVDVNGNDEADALILAAMGARWLGQPLELGLSIPQISAMDKVAWPAHLRGVA